MLTFHKGFLYKGRLVARRRHDGKLTLTHNWRDSDLIRAGKRLIEKYGEDAFIRDADYDTALACEEEGLPCEEVNTKVTFDDSLIVCNAPTAPAVMYNMEDKRLRAAAALYLAAFDEPKGYEEDDEDFRRAKKWLPRREGDLVYMGKKVVARHTSDGLVFEDTERGRLVEQCTWAHGVL